MAAVLGARRGLPALLIIIGALVGLHMKVSNKLGRNSGSNTEHLLAMSQIRCKNVIGGVTAGLEQQINVKVESNVSYEGIRPLVMAARTAIDIIAASSDAVKQGDRLDEIPAVELSIGEEVLIRPWDVWLGNNRHHRTGLVYNARKEMENNVASCMQFDTTGYHRGDDTAGVVKLIDASTAPATKESSGTGKGEQRKAGIGNKNVKENNGPPACYTHLKISGNELSSVEK